MWLRVRTALILLTLVTVALWCTNPLYWHVLVTLGFYLAIQEWHTLHADSMKVRILGDGLAFGALLWSVMPVLMKQAPVYFVPPWVWLVSALSYPFLLVLTLSKGAVAWGRYPAWLRDVGGWAVLSLLCLALWQARAMGLGFLLSVLSLVWVSDVGAYFVGRRWGRHRLAAQISPGKTWEGVLGGALAVLVWAGVWTSIEGFMGQTMGDPRPGHIGHSLYVRLWQHGGVVWFLGLMGMTGLGVAGDLWESLVKRYAGVKDSGDCLPGHGGVLDRIDALIPVVPTGVCLGLFA